MRQRGNVVQSMLAGGVVLGALPLGLGVIFVTAGHDEDGGSRAAELFTEAGPWAYAVLAGTLVASVIAALMVGLSGKRPALLPVAVLAFAFPLLAAVLGGELGLRAVMDAVVHAAPADQLTIIAASTGESIELTHLTNLIIGTAWVLVALGALLTLGAGQPLPRLGVVGGAGLLGLSAFALAYHSIQMSGIFRAVAHVAPGDRGHILGMGLIEAEPSHLAGMALLAVSVLVALAAGATAFRTSPPLGLAMLVGCLSGAVALATLEARSRHNSFFVPEGMGSWVVADAVEVRGRFSGGECLWLEAGDSLERLDERVRENAEQYRNADQKLVTLGMMKTDPRDRVLRVLQRAHEAGFAVELIGRGPTKVVEAPPYARRFIELLAESMQGVRVELRTAGEACEDCVGVAKVSGGKLEVSLTGKPPQTWAVEDEFDQYGTTRPQLDFQWTGGVDELVRAGSVAFSHGHELSIAVPALE